ncbi:sec-independent protein translocase protein TATB, chloroplastic [Ziziphus jujuba]|uniref:Sec-independent protein translocase protein TATB, chloroplastic n=2 Tax=Ziziphus jujuba TaxID=326968 RepID=A0A6P4AIY8_ZIZJJ|nr:sec-independent protein translocase protein TATB, chloroplastic [Ziziphus jujuba]KAH7538078.1 hypothetical protein FEM48_Zijuj03G0160900 [Ziziphus jujuba var. spinosa]
MITLKVMAGSISAPTCLCSSSSSSTYTSAKLAIFNLSASAVSQSKTSPFYPRFSLFSQWNGLKHLGISVSPKSLKFERKRRYKNRVVYASLFGVGAPEALVIGVVALLVFGPKGLAEVARNLGKTLRAFQPTIRELQEVSREFKSTLEKEIGLDEVSGSIKSTDAYRANATSSPTIASNDEASKITADPNGGASSPSRAYTSEESLKITEEQLKASAAGQQQAQTSASPESESADGSTSSPSRAYTSEEYLKITEEQLKASAAAQQQAQTSSLPESKSEAQTNPQASVEEAPARTPSAQQSGRET